MLTILKGLTRAYIALDTFHGARHSAWLYRRSEAGAIRLSAKSSVDFAGVQNAHLEPAQAAANGCLCWTSLDETWAPHIHQRSWLVHYYRLDQSRWLLAGWLADNPGMQEVVGDEME